MIYKRIPKLAIVSSLILIFVSSSTFAQENEVKYLRKNEPAPFSGMLLSDSAAIENKVRFDTLAKLQEAEIEKLKAISEAEKTALTETFDVQLQQARDLHDFEVRMLNEQIDFIKENLVDESFFNSFEFGVAVGVISTLGIVVAVGYSLKNI